MRPALCPVLVGREEEIRQLRAALADAQAGRGRTVLLAGDAGIGKSRLAREIADEARRVGVAVLTGRAVAGEVPAPFRPFAEALAAALRPGDLPKDGALVPFLPALGQLAPHLRSEQSAPAEESLVYLGEAVLQLLRVHAPERGALLVLEDLHWADQETLSLLEYLADNALAERFLLVGTFRWAEGGDAPELAAKLETRGSAEVMTLRRLDPQAVAAMSQACLGGQPGELPASAQSFVTDRADGIPFLVEELLASLLADEVLVRRAGSWQTTGQIAATVPATFADSVVRRIEGAGPDLQAVIRAAAVLGRQFDWSLLGSMTRAHEDVVVSALREGVELQLIEPGEDGFRFRHALTQEAVLSAMLPPERAALAARALDALLAARPDLPGAWCMLAADLAVQAGDSTRAAAMLLEAGRRELSLGALGSAEQTLLRARELGRAGALAAQVDIDEVLTEVYARSGQVDLAIETGQRLLDRISPLSAADPAARSAALHLKLAEAAIAGGRWADADASLQAARQLGDPGLAPRLDVRSAQVAEGRHRPQDAARLASQALVSAWDAEVHEVAYEALELIGRLARNRDLDAAEEAFSRAASIASSHQLELCYLRAMRELGTIDYLRTGSVDRLGQARELASERGALALTAALDLLIAAGLNRQFRADEALRAATRAGYAAGRFGLASLPMALVMQAAAHAIRGEEADMEAAITQATDLAPKDLDVQGGVLGYCRATLFLLAEDPARAHEQMAAGARLVLRSSSPYAPAFLGLWPVLGAALDREAAESAAEVRAALGTRHRIITALLGYADAIEAGRKGDAAAAMAAFTAADASMHPLEHWHQQYARRTVAQAALADGWGEPVFWLREAAAYFEARGDERIAAACRRLLRDAGAVVPRPRPGNAGLPGRLRADGITGREADVLSLVVRGLTNREIAAQLFLSPRTVEKHVASLLGKTGLRRRAQLAGYLAGLDG